MLPLTFYFAALSTAASAAAAAATAAGLASSLLASRCAAGTHQQADGQHMRHVQSHLLLLLLLVLMVGLGAALLWVVPESTGLS
jgi:NhaP-type Na+/H+ or K+/H+ antiporter